MLSVYQRTKTKFCIYYYTDTIQRVKDCFEVWQGNLLFVWRKFTGQCQAQTFSFRVLHSKFSFSHHRSKWDNPSRNTSSGSLDGQLRYLRPWTLRRFSLDVVDQKCKDSKWFYCDCWSNSMCRAVYGKSQTIQRWIHPAKWTYLELSSRDLL
jgi:hypothetical protein